jgi:hypothetical protein
MSFDNGIQVPGWAVAAVVAVFAILGVGYQIGNWHRGAQDSDEVEVLRNSVRIDNIDGKVGQLDFRLCRIEKALNIAPDQSCYNTNYQKAIQ